MQSFPKAKFSSLHMLGEPFAWHHWTRGAAQLCIQPPWGFTRRLGWSNLLILWILELWFSKSIIMWLSVPQERSKRQFHDRDFGKHLSSTHQTMTSSWGLSASTSLCIFCVAHCCETLFLPVFCIWFELYIVKHTLKCAMFQWQPCKKKYWFATLQPMVAHV